MYRDLEFCILFIYLFIYLFNIYLFIYLAAEVCSFVELGGVPEITLKPLVEFLSTFLLSIKKGLNFSKNYLLVPWRTTI